MKKITLLGAALFALAQVQAQTSEVSTLGINDPIILSTGNTEFAPCDSSNPSNAFENGKSNTASLLRIVANDVEVNADETLTLETITFNQFVLPPSTVGTVDVYIYADAGGAPGAVVNTQLAMVPTSQLVVGSNFGFNIHETVLDIVDFPLVGQAGTPTTYWIGTSVNTTAFDNTFWENTTASISGNGEAYDAGTGGGYIVDGTLDGVYTFSGDCNPLLGVGSNLLSQVSVYPNPTSDVLNIKVPASVEVTGAVLYDVLGKNTGVSIVNGTMNTGSLAKGVYILSLKTTAGTLTQKIVKN